MLTTPLFLAVAVWLAILFVGFMMTTVGSIEDSTPDAERHQAVIGVSTACSIAAVAAIAFAVAMRKKVKTATFWAGTVLVLVALSQAIYKVVPPPASAGPMSKSQENSLIVSAVALGAGVLTFGGAAWLKLRK